MTDSGIDLDADGKYDVLRVTVNVSVRAESMYGVGGDLSRDPVSIAHSWLSVPLQKGDRVVELDFSGIEIRKKNQDGPYEVSVTVTDTLELHESWIEHTTGSYLASEFDLSALTPTGKHSDRGLDLDGDGDYDVLRTSFEVSSEVSGSVTLMGSLTEPPAPGEDYGTYVATGASDVVKLVEGVQTLSLDFRGVDIRRHGVDGPYFLANVGVLGEHGALDQLTLGNLTKAYRVRQFEEGPPILRYLDYFTAAATDIDGNGLAESLSVSLRIQSSQNGPVSGTANLFDRSGRYIANGTGGVVVHGGVPALLDIRFDGRYVYGNLKNGPFEIKDAYVYSSRDVRGGIKIPVVGKTRAYKFGDFEHVGVIRGIVEAAQGIPAIQAELRSFEYVDYTDSTGAYRLIFLRPGTKLVKAKCKQGQEWQIVLNGRLVGVGDTVSVDVDAGHIDTLNFLRKQRRR